jgi:hypothetical protein
MSPSGGMMTRTQQLSIVLSAANLLLLAGIVLGRVPPLLAKTQAEGVLRGRALEIVDARGVVRFSVEIAAPTTEGGKPLPDRVLLRVGSPGAGPGVKLVSSADGTDLLIMHNDRPSVRLAAHGDSGFVKVVSGAGKERLVLP